MNDNVGQVSPGWFFFSGEISERSLISIFLPLTSIATDLHLTLPMVAIVNQIADSRIELALFDEGEPIETTAKRKCENYQSL